MSIKPKIYLVGWFEEYKCGCVSDVVKIKKDLSGFCPKHGNDVKKIYPYYKRMIGRIK